MNVPVLALTATITTHMQNDIFQALHLDDKCKVVAELPNRYVGHMNIMIEKIEIKRAIWADCVNNPGCVLSGLYCIGPFKLQTRNNAECLCSTTQFETP